MIRKIWNLGFDIVYGCQLRCIGCPNSIIKPKVRTISVEDFETCLKNVDVKVVNLFRLFNYGEPLLHPDIPGCIAAIKRQSFEVRKLHISTNAQHHDFPQLEEIFRTRALYKLTASCDGDGTPAEYERQRPPARWDKLMEFLRRAAEFRDKHSPDTILQSSSIVETDDDRRRWTEILEPLGWEPQFRERMNMAQSVDFDPEAAKARVKNELCEHMQITSLYVNVDGDVVPCCRHPKAAVLGNLKKETFSQIYHGKKRKAFADRLKKDRVNMPICGECDEPRHMFKLERMARKIFGL